MVQVVVTCEGQRRRFESKTINDLLPAATRRFGVGDLVDNRGCIITSPDVELKDGMEFMWELQDVAGPGPSSQAAVHRPAEQQSKRIKIAHPPSDLLPSAVENLQLIPSSTHERFGVAFYAGRKTSAPLNIAPPGLLCAPELGVVHDAIVGDPSYTAAPQADDYTAATELCKSMADVYPTEKARQEAFISWFNKTSGFSMSVPSTSSASGRNDGVLLVTVGDRSYPICMLEVKNEIGSSGDPTYQILRYYQLQYEDGKRWDFEPALRASGGPALLLHVVGPYLGVAGVYTLEGNVVSSELLTPMLPLLPVASRMHTHLTALARVVAALRGSLKLLHRRLHVMAGGVGLEPPCDIVSRVLPGLPDAGQRALRAALSAATLLPGPAQLVAASQAAAAARLSHASQPFPRNTQRPWTRLPYHLYDPTQYERAESLHCLACKPLFVCTPATSEQRSSSEQSSSGRDSRRVVVKFTARPYPEEVHRSWAAAGLAPQINKVMRLPGGWWLVEQELLDETWITFERLSNEDRQLAASALRRVEEAVKAAHGVSLEGTEHKLVHGDMRPPNIMVRRQEAPAGPTWEVRLIDFDWSGVHGQDRYPPTMNMSGAIQWAPGAGPGQLLLQQHDLHMLEHMLE